MSFLGEWVCRRRLARRVFARLLPRLTTEPRDANPGGRFRMAPSRLSAGLSEVSPTLPAGHSQDIIDAYYDAIPLNRYGSERKIAEAILFLCSDKAS